MSAWKKTSGIRFELSQKQAEQKLDAEKWMADAQVALAPAQQEAAAKQELRNITEEAMTERSRIKSDAKVAMTKALSDGAVERVTYLSGNPALQFAATITATDAEVVNAKALDMAAAILGN